MGIMMSPPTSKWSMQPAAATGRKVPWNLRLRMALTIMYWLPEVSKVASTPAGLARTADQGDRATGVG